MKSELAATTKLLKAVASLRFANRRTFTIEHDVSWLAKSKLTPTDKKQLVAIVALCGGKPPITVERALTTAPETLFVGELGSFAEHAVEWFDVLDQDSVVQLQLWLYGGDRGVLFKAATTTSVAPIDECTFAGSGSGLDEATGERLAALLRKAKKIAASLHPGSALASIGF
jgi:hypothetical protein